MENYLIYDGECPFCSNFVRLARLRETLGPIHLVNARDEGPELKDATKHGYTIDDGMVLFLDGQYFHGAECMNKLALLSSRSSVFNKIVLSIFRMPTLARFLYPILKAGRNLTIRLLGISKLGY